MTERRPYLETPVPIAPVLRPSAPSAEQPPSAETESPRRRWRHDLEASVVVFLVALPLSLGIAVASGAPVTGGIIAAVVGGVVAGALGGVPLQVSGPAAGLIAIVAEIVASYGWQVACFVTAAAGVLQIVLGLSRVARAALAISPAVVHGMLAGIGLTIVIGQLHVVLGGTTGSSAVENLIELPGELVDLRVPAAAALGLLTIGVTVLWPRLPRPLPAVPAPLIAVAVATLASVPFDVPRVTLPSNLLDSLALPRLPDGRWAGIAIAVLTVAAVASIESLLSAVAVDSMRDGPRGNLDRELVGQGVANTVSGLAGGLPVTGVIVRSSTNVRAGARTRASAILHGLWMAAFVLLLAPLVRQIPLAVLAGLLVVIGTRLVDLADIRAVARHRELVTYIATAAGVVLLNLLEGVLVGIGVALLLALRRALTAPVHVHAPARPGLPWRVVVEGTLTFLSLPRLTRQLAGIPADAPVRLELLVDYLDHAAYQTLDDWARARERAGAQVVIDEVGPPVLSRIRDGLPLTRRVPSPRAPRWLAPWSDWQDGHIHDRRNLLVGVDEFHHRTAPLLQDSLRALGQGQRPSTLFITCSDSRVVPNVLTSSGPGDLFTVRSVGALVPGPDALGDSTLAAVEYAVSVLRVRTIVVCGHSGCGAMRALLDAQADGGRTGLAGPMPHLEHWLRHGEQVLAQVGARPSGLDEASSLDDADRLDDADHLSQVSVAQQLDNLRLLGPVREAEADGRLHLVGMWFDIATARVVILDEDTARFTTPRLLPSERLAVADG